MGLIDLITRRGNKELFLLIVDFFLYVLDICTDIYVINEYNHNHFEEWWFGVAIAIFVFSILIVSIAVILQAIFKGEDECDESAAMCYLNLVLAWPFVLVRYAKMFRLWWKTYSDDPIKNRILKYKKAEHYLAWIHYVRGITESAPQWFLQVYVMLHIWCFPFWAIFSAVISLVSLAWSITTLERTRNTSQGRDVKTRNVTVLFTYELFTLLSRLFAIVIFTYVFKSHIFPVLILHWLVMNLFLVLMRLFLNDKPDESDDCKRDCREILCSFVAYSTLSYHMNFHVSKALLKEYKCYTAVYFYTLFCVMAVENFVLTLIAIFVPRPNVNHWDELAPTALAFVTLGIILSAVLSVVYYIKKQ